MNTRITRTIATVALAATPTLGVLSFADSASAKGREVIRTGRCSNGASWKLKAKAEDGGLLDVEFEVDANRNRQRWSVAVNDNGVRVFTGVRFTHAPSGSFSVERLIADRAGVDHITATAVRTATGATCRAALDF